MVSFKRLILIYSTPLTRMKGILLSYLVLESIRTTGIFHEIILTVS